MIFAETSYMGVYLDHQKQHILCKNHHVRLKHIKCLVFRENIIFEIHDLFGFSCFYLFTVFHASRLELTQLIRAQFEPSRVNSNSGNNIILDWYEFYYSWCLIYVS